jgi:ketosteroid isomerase-like protein
MFQLISRVQLYYDSIDSGNIDQALQLFHPKALYDRGGQVIQEIETFYRSQRDIGESKHFIKKISASDGVVVTCGIFVGTNKTGLPLYTEFNDIFVFDDDVIVYRMTKFLGQNV